MVNSTLKNKIYNKLQEFNNTIKAYDRINATLSELINLFQ